MPQKCELVTICETTWCIYNGGDTRPEHTMSTGWEEMIKRNPRIWCESHTTKKEKDIEK